MSGFNMDDYVPVNERIEAFYKKHPDGSLQSEILAFTDSRVTVKAYAYRHPEDPKPGTGLSSETIPGSTSFTKGSEVENAETSAWGRAIAALGFEVKRGIASREEMRRQQPQDGERGSRRMGVPPARTRPAADSRGPDGRTAEERALIAELLDIPQMSAARMSLLANDVGVVKGELATADQLREMIARSSIELPEPAAVPTPVAPDHPSAPHAEDETGAGSSDPPPSTSSDTPPTGAETPAAATDASEGSSPPAAPEAPAPSMEDVPAVTGGTEIPPKPGSPEYKALPSGNARAKAKAYWDKHPDGEQETLAQALGAPVAE